MAIIIVIVIIFAVVAGIAGGLTFVNAASSISTRRDPATNELKAKLRAEREQNMALTRLVRRIAANDVGNAPLEAQLCLEEIDKKELET
jgi:hypothetical protein